MDCGHGVGPKHSFMRVVPTTRKEVGWERGHGQPRHDVLNKQKLLVWIEDDCDHTNKVIYLL